MMIKFYLTILSSLIAIPIYAQRIVIDRRAIQQVNQNATAAIAQETLVKKQYESARKAQEAINKYATIVQVNLERIEKAKRDISAFQQGTYNIKILSKYLIACLKEVKELASDIPKYPFGTLAQSKKIGSATEHIIGIGVKISSAVTDGQVTLEGISYPSKTENLIDPVKRLELINNCIYELQRIFSILRNIRIELSMRNTMYHAALTLTPTAALTKDQLDVIAQDVKRLWYD